MICANIRWVYEKKVSPFESVEDGEERRVVAVGRVRWWIVRRLNGEVGLQSQIVVRRREEGREGNGMELGADMSWRMAWMDRLGCGD